MISTHSSELGVCFLLLTVPRAVLQAEAAEEAAVKEEEDDELADLWRNPGAPPGAPPGHPGQYHPGYGHPQMHPGYGQPWPAQQTGPYPGAGPGASTNPFSAPPTGNVIQTSPFIGGGTGLPTAPNAPNPLLMPGAKQPPTTNTGPNPNNPFAQSMQNSQLQVRPVECCSCHGCCVA